MATRNLPVRNAFTNLDPLRIDAARLRKARRILQAESDVDAVNKALAHVISSQEMESAIEKAFGPLPYFESR